MYTNVWYVAARSEDVAGVPHHVRMLGRDFVLLRDPQGVAHCLSNVCVHRGASLAHGRCHPDGTLACPFHGWRFNAAGRCTEIPSEGAGARIPSAARVDSYPTTEKFGLVWTFLGDEPEQAMPLFDMPEFGNPQWRSVNYDQQWSANYIWTKMANLDHVHLPIVHGTFFGGDNPVRPPDHQIEFLPNGFRTQIQPQPPRPKGAWGKLRDEGRKITSRLTFYVPGFTLRGDIEIGGTDSGIRFVFYETSTPIDDQTTMMRWIFFRNFLLEPKKDADHLKRNLKNLGEDKAIAEAMMPKRPPSVRGERQICVDREDRLMQAFWFLMRQMRERGWQIDHERLAALESAQDAGYRVIPSPGRRQDPAEWVHDVVPRVPAAELAAGFKPFRIRNSAAEESGAGAPPPAEDAATELWDASAG
jgi:phenylpropionate dioxygenase-like ring-hydroxylating dioxygenase large terminal subunit